MNRISGDFLTLFFPPRCCLCRGARVLGESEICSVCLMRLPREINYQGRNNTTATRLQGILKFSRAFSFLRYSKKSDVQKLIHLLKYQGKIHLGFQLGKWFAAEVLCHFGNAFDLVMPVPLHPEKLKTRGFNQSRAIAEGICRVTGHTLIDGLSRKHIAATQTQLTRWQRFENTANEFSLVLPQAVKNKNVLLLDDIITTGATISGSAIPLLEGGVRHIIVASIGLTQDA